MNCPIITLYGELVSVPPEAHRLESNHNDLALSRTNSSPLTWEVHRPSECTRTTDSAAGGLGVQPKAQIPCTIVCHEEIALCALPYHDCAEMNG